MHLIDKSSAQILPDCSNPAAQPDIATGCSVHRPFQRGVNAVGHKVEGGASAHADRCARMFGQHENRRVVWRILAPPSLPSVVSPWSAHRAKHVAANDPRPNIVEASCREVVIHSRGAAVLAMHLSKGAGGEDPFVQRSAADAKGIVEILIKAGPVTIERNRESIDAKLGHKFRALRRSKSGLDNRRARSF
ncbi:hypothetical protein SBA7_40033 [Candidatus Sulfotelmatobacter sp. SbA7]|nr:hypothetical protein SBA7_40033 [Candidatus Sulfotelmatobacter sp. SbA7]